MPENLPQNDRDDGWVERVLPTELQAIRESEGDILRRLDELCYDEDQRFAVRLAFEEALLNAMKHGNKMNPDLSVSLAYRVTDEAVEIHITDQGRGFNPNGVPDPTADENLQRPCGRGVMLMYSYMDEVTYAEGGKQVRMVKYRKR